MANDLIRIRGADVGPSHLILPENLSEGRWADIGEQLAEMQLSVGWWIGDWWNAGERYGDRAQIVKSPDWHGPTYQTCRTCGWVAARFQLSSRKDSLLFEHHREAARLPLEIGNLLLAEMAEKAAANGGHPPPAGQIKAEWKRRLRADRAASGRFVAPPQLGTFGRFDVIYADPPWRFETWSENGMDRAADNHYPTMATDEIAKLDVPAVAADDCALFLWATAAMMPAALHVMSAWGFAYKAHWIWLKPRAGTGYWQRNRHEMLMLGTQGRVAAPDPADRYDSVIALDSAEHSVKPDGFAEMIEAMFPTCSLLEMFARTSRLGWTTWGNEPVFAASTV